ncbi:MAG TPA: LCP family protein [Oscillospiraceae bacterium]|nr:LCP family protein [Oscillospiraceae bacterium]HNW05051.1 LCP family protein [Oscillospiraceae bacterium]
MKVRMFLLAFTASFLLLFCGAAYAVFSLSQAGPQAPTPQNPVSAGGYIPREEDNFTVLLIGMDYGGDSADYFTLARFDIPAGRIPVFTFPASCAVSYENRETEIGALCDLYGAEALVSALETEYSLKIDDWLRYDRAGCEAIVDTLGSYDLSLPRALVYADGVRSIHLLAGAQRMNGKKTYDVISFPDFTETERCDRISKLVAAFLNRRLVRLTEKGGNCFDAVAEHTEASFGAKEHQLREPALAFLASLDVTVASHITMDAELRGGALYLSDAARARLLKYFV